MRADRPTGTPVTAHTRIVGWMVLLVGVALGVLIFLVHTVLTVRLDERVAAELEHEADKLRAFTQAAAAPETGQPFTDVDALIDQYLRANLPDRHETFFTVIDGRVAGRSADRPHERLDTDDAFVRDIARTREAGIDSFDSGAGEVRYVAVPVRLPADDRQAVFVAAEFRDQMKANEVDLVAAMLASAAVGAMVLAGGAIWLIAGQVLAPMRLVRRTAEEISDSDLTTRIPIEGSEKSNDDVVALARTFNAMLDRLEHAFTTQRHFLDDVNHELRTPITVIRGHLETASDDPADRAQTTALVIDELQRMTRIVDDLTVLAKADRPDFLEWADVDPADLVIDVLAKVRVLGERTWTLDEVAHCDLRGDPQRLTQALVQLVSNALRYTSDGDVIAVGSHAEPGSVRFWVRDEGSGVPPDVTDRLFDRFVRIGPRSGAGLGLAIVRAIADAHGGRASLETDRQLGGTTVTLEVPR